ncbi:MAG: hypothetical protein U0R19_40035 [Bryobacteraceae bacterium]
MRLHSYVVARDFGFAPNPFFGICSLATCKPGIRKIAAIGDWIVGTGSKTRGRHRHVVYAMRVTGAMTFEQYWAAPQFQRKKVNLRGSKKQAFGDNIYSRTALAEPWCQANSHHSLHDGSPNPLNVRADTSTNRVLISDDFVYWGGSGPELPARFLDYGPTHESICAGRGHKNGFSPLLVTEFVAWIRSLNEMGYSGEPLDWAKTP